MSGNRRDQRELFARPRDVVRANLIVENHLGVGFDVHYTGLPKSVGAKGDEGVRGASVIISAKNHQVLKRVIDEAHQAQQSGGEQPTLDKVMGDICGATSACRVLVDITPNSGPFEIAD